MFSILCPLERVEELLKVRGRCSQGKFDRFGRFIFACGKRLKLLQKSHACVKALRFS
jgi:hypothetical protein